MSSSVTLYSDVADGYVASTNAVYATARSGGSKGVDTTAGVAVVGQRYNGSDYICYEAFLGWDTSVLPDDCVITSATIAMAWDSKDAANWTVNVRPYDWGTTVTGADWVAGESLSGLTLLASKGTTGTSVHTYYDFTSTAGLLTAISKTGFTRVVVSSSLVEAGTTPTGYERLYIHPGEDATYAASLTIVYESSWRGMYVTRELNG